MTAQRPYRAGLGLPEAVVIRSGPAPSHARSARPPALGGTAGDHNHAETFNPFGGIIGPLPPPGVTFQEWSINPTKHGPERLRGPPVFVPSQLSYDELGRSIGDGVGVMIQQARGGEGRDREDGAKLAEWYASLSRTGSGTSTPVSAPPAKAKRMEIPLNAEVVDFTEESDEDDFIVIEPERSEPKPNDQVSKPKIGHSAGQADAAAESPQSSERRDWFTSSAYAAFMNTQAQAQPSATKTSSSIGSMINIQASQPRVAIPTYHLGPDNKGYVMLDRLGWEGGGLGRHPDYDPEAGPSRLPRRELSIEREIPSVINERGEEVLDFTNELEEEEDLSSSRMGPGRTAPIATVLKLDRLGLGHVRYKNPSNAAIAKKVTHTAREISQAQKKAKYAGVPTSGLELGKKGKIKWQDKERRDRDERRRLIAMMGS